MFPIHATDSAISLTCVRILLQLHLIPRCCGVCRCSERWLRQVDCDVSHSLRPHPTLSGPSYVKVIRDPCNRGSGVEGIRVPNPRGLLSAVRPPPHTAPTSMVQQPEDERSGATRSQRTLSDATKAPESSMRPAGQTADVCVRHGQEGGSSCPKVNEFSISCGSVFPDSVVQGRSCCLCCSW